MASFSVQDLSRWVEEDFEGALSFCYGAIRDVPALA